MSLAVLNKRYDHLGDIREGAKLIRALRQAIRTKCISCDPDHALWLPEERLEKTLMLLGCGLEASMAHSDGSDFKCCLCVD